MLHANIRKKTRKRNMNGEKKINKGALLQVIHGLIAKYLHVSMWCIGYACVHICVCACVRACVVLNVIHILMKSVEL